MTGLTTVNEALLLADQIEAETLYRLQLARELSEITGCREYQRGAVDGYTAAVMDLKALQRGLVLDAELERRRWHLCCPRCRLTRHRDGCRHCEDRTRETFSSPRTGDFPGRGSAAA